MALQGELDALQTLTNLSKKVTKILFDEWFCYHNHERYIVRI